MPTSFFPPFPRLAEGRPLFGVPSEALTTDEEQAVTVTLVDGDGGGNHALGVFRVDEDGRLADGEIVIPGTPSPDPESPPPETGGSTFVDVFPAGTRLGLFMIEGGGDLIADLPGTFLGGEVLFREDGETATLEDPGRPEVLLRAVVEDAEGAISVVETAVRRPVYLTADPTPDTPLTNEMNDGGFAQAVAGDSPDRADALRIGFEAGILDRSDLDFNDVVLDVTFTDTAPGGEEPVRLVAVGSANEVEPGVYQLTAFD